MWCLSNLQFFLAVQVSSFLIHSFTLTQSVRPPQVICPSLCTVQYLSYLRDIMPLHLSLSTSCSTLTSEEKDFPMGKKYSIDVLLLTCRAYFSPKYITWSVLFICYGQLQNIISTSCRFGIWFLIAEYVESHLS